MSGLNPSSKANGIAAASISSGYVPKLIIEKDRLFTENANRSNGHGVLDLSSFKPFSKNPAISKVFREIGWSDELGSGMRNTYKYTKLCSGGTPEFIEGDVFCTIIPLAAYSAGKVAPRDPPQDSPQDRILAFCCKLRSKFEITEYLGYKDIKTFSRRYLRPLLESGAIRMTIPEKPRSKYQKYVTVSSIVKSIR